MDSELKPMSTKELTQAVATLLEREERREQLREKRRKKKVVEERQRLQASVDQLAASVNVIKWCVVGIASVMAVALLVLILVIVEVEREVERVKLEAEKIVGRVHEIEAEAEKIREKIRHPLETLGGSLGRSLESKIFDALTE